MGAEIQRKQQLINATIQAIGETGSLDVTVGKIAKIAGVSSALAFHYFGDKEALFLAAMRDILQRYSRDVSAALAVADTPEQRLDALIRANFGTSHFDRGVIAAWMNFYVLAQRSDAARRLLRIYHARLLSNLAHALRPLTGDQARSIALRLSAQIDGIYLRAALNPTGASPEEAAAQVLATLKRELAF